MPEPPPLLAVVGATATGKSELAAELALRLGGEVLSCDASCVYRGLDLGTAKPGAELTERVAHHLVDLCDPGADFTAADWLARAAPLVDRLQAEGRLPVLAGGTGLYLRLLLRGLVESPPPDPALRSRLEERERRRPGSLHRLLRRLDPAVAAGEPPAQTTRLVRALEHRLLTGRPLGEDRRRRAAAPPRPAVKIGLRLGRPEREGRIRRRVQAMLEAGWLGEVEGLLARGLRPDARSLRAIGYRELAAHLRGELGFDEAVERIVVATRRYAKRQDTWFRREADVRWFDAARARDELPDLIDRVMMTLPSVLRERAREARPTPPARHSGARPEEPGP